VIPATAAIHIAAARARNSIGYEEEAPTAAPSVMRIMYMGRWRQLGEASLIMIAAEATHGIEDGRKMDSSVEVVA
jgi:hypothetical protein